MTGAGEAADATHVVVAVAITALGPGAQLWLLAGRLRGGEPVAGADHDELRWLSFDELAGLDWLPADRELLPGLSAAMHAGTGPSARHDG